MESIFDNGAAVSRAQHGDNAVEGTNKIGEVGHYRASHGVNIMCCATKSLKEVYFFQLFKAPQFFSILLSFLTLPGW